MIIDSLNGVTLNFESTQKCFSPQNLDKGTLAMLSFVKFKKNDKVLDLGCGYGLVGIYAAKVGCPENIYMVDINPEAILCSQKNAKLNDVQGVHIVLSNAYERLNETSFDVILSNPPYHADFSVPKVFIEKGFNRLKIGGHFYMVTKRREWYKNKFISIFGGVKIYEKDGYYIFEAEKRNRNYKNRVKKSV